MKIKHLLIAFGISGAQLVSAQWTASTVTGATTDALQSVCFADATTAYTTGWSGVLFKSTDAGVNWSSLTGTGGYPALDMYGIDFADANTGIAAGAVGRIYKTTDGGTSWTLKTSGTTQEFAGVTFLSNGLTVYAYGASGTVVMSTDAGDTWTTLTSPTTQVVRRIEAVPGNETTLFLASDNSGGGTSMYKSIDGGVSWTTSTVPPAADGDPVSLFGLSVVDANTVFVAGGSKRIAKTTDGGTNWTNINSSLANFYRACYFTSATSGYVVGQAGKILTTSNGTSFTTETSGVTDILNFITKNADGTFLVVGNNCTIIRKGQLPNQAPTAVADNSTTTEDVAVVTNVLANDSDDGALVNSTLTVTVQPADGTTVVNTLTGEITYTPTTGFIGMDTYTYQICDDGTPSLCSTATVTITVNPAVTNQAPVAVADASTTPQDTPVVTDVLANDTDSDGSIDATSVTITVQPTNGTTSVDALTGAVTYTPNAGYVGSDSYTYQVCDDGSPALCATAVVTITVTAAGTNVAPVATDDNGGNVTDGASASVAILSNDTDQNETVTTLTHTVDLDLVTAGVQSTMTTTSPDVTWTYDIATGMLTCSPALGVTGALTITYRLCDSGDLCDDAVVTFNAVAGIEEHVLVTKVYPNPVKDVISLETAQVATGAKIIALDGKTVATLKVSKENIAIPAIQAGMYILEVTFETGSVSRTNFIKE